MIVMQHGNEVEVSLTGSHTSCTIFFLYHKLDLSIHCWDCGLSQLILYFTNTDFFLIHQFITWGRVVDHGTYLNTEIGREKWKERRS